MSRVMVCSKSHTFVLNTYYVESIIVQEVCKYGVYYWCTENGAKIERAALNILKTQPPLY